MLAMLDALDTHPGDTVFEFGTGTGYNAAMLNHCLGADHVTIVDVDPGLVALAARRLGDLGLKPFVTAGDGALGYPTRSPYSRIIATAALRCIPPALMEQAAPGAVIVAPIGYGIIRAVVTEPGHAEGRFLSRPTLFMPRRSPSRRPDFDTLRDQVPQTTGLPVADALNRWKFPLPLALPGYSSCTWRDDGTLTAVGLWTEDGSAATASVNGHVRQTGRANCGAPWKNWPHSSPRFPQPARTSASPSPPLANASPSGQFRSVPLCIRGRTRATLRRRQLRSGLCGAGSTPVVLILVLVLVAVGLSYGIQFLKRNKPESDSPSSNERSAS